MGRRSQRPELEFGSDSFLDVICNIVGILIILIVVVAVKVERQPRAQAEAMANAAQVEPPIPDRESEYTQRQSDLDAMKQQHSRVASRLQELTSRKALLHQEHRLVQEEMDALQNQLAAQTADTQRIKVAQSDAENEAGKLSADVERLLNILAGKEKALKNAITVIQQEESVATEAKEKLRQTIVETVRLREVLDDTAKPADSSPRLVHRIMPVSRKTNGEEV